MNIAVGHSDAVDWEDAAREVLAKCQEQLAGATPKAALVFASIDLDHAPMLHALSDGLPGVPLIGCTSDGEFTNSSGYFDDSLVLTVFFGEGIEARAGLGRDLAADVEKAATEAVRGATEECVAPVFCLTTPESMGVDTARVVRALDRAMGEQSCPLLGGTSGDHRQFSTTHQFFGREVLTNALPLMMFWGDVAISHGVASGWRPVGPTHRVTRAEANVVYEIDGRPSMEVFRDYWNEGVPGVLGQFPLAVLDDESPDGFYLRAVFETHPDEGHAVFAAEVPEGAEVRITEVLRSGILDGSTEAVRKAVEGFPPSAAPTVALVFSCAARKWQLGTRVAEEVSVLTDALPEGVRTVGFYCFGEIGPITRSGTTRFHNETCVILLLGRG